MTRRVIVNADDFGLSHEHNVAVMETHRAGAIASTSLMMGECGTAEAIAMAQANPDLAIGLHVALSDATPVLAPDLVSALVQADGCFYPNESALLQAALSVRSLRQVRAEIHAQFTAFHATGLQCDHVNTHRHVHKLPHIALLVFNEAQKWGIKTSRIPWDPNRTGLAYFTRLIRYYLLVGIMRRAKINTIYSSAGDESVGGKWSPATLINVLQTLPVAGQHELYFHPVTRPDHPFSADLPTLLDSKVLPLLRELRTATD